MILWNTIDIADNERALLYRRNRLERVLEPGRHRINALAGKTRLEKYDATNIVFDHAKAKFLLNTQAEKLSGFIDRFELTDMQVGLFYSDGHLVDILAPGTYPCFLERCLLM